jgi:plastocyanin
MKSGMPAATVLAVACLASVVGISSSVPAMAYDEAGAVAGGGTVSGQVVFHGTVPTRQIIPNKDVETCGGPREDALIEVGPGQGVANTLVYLADVDKGKAWPAATKQQLVNHRCRFEPEMQVIRAGSIDIVNKDPVLHNTHGYYGRRTAFNTALPNQNQSVTTELLKTGTVRVDCDAHGWMEGWIFVRDNPYYAVTGPDGKFSIADVPPGTYKLVVLQPYSKLIEQSVTVGSGKSSDLSFELQPNPQ